MLGDRLVPDRLAAVARRLRRRERDEDGPEERGEEVVLRPGEVFLSSPAGFAHTVLRGDGGERESDGDEAVAMNCLSTELNEVYDLKYKTIHGIMTYVKESHRRKGIATKFKKHLFKWVISNGYERAIGEWMDKNAISFAHTEASLKEFNLEIDKESTQYVAKLQ